MSKCRRKENSHARQNNNNLSIKQSQGHLVPPHGLKWHPTPIILPGKSHGQRSLVGQSPWGCKESNTAERLHFFFCFVYSSFSSCLCVRLGCLFVTFFLFPKVRLYCYKLSSQNCFCSILYVLDCFVFIVICLQILFFFSDIFSGLLVVQYQCLTSTCLCFLQFIFL